jgi:hypothetical protein
MRRRGALHRLVEEVVESVEREGRYYPSAYAFEGARELLVDLETMFD